MDWTQRLSIMDQVGYVEPPAQLYRLCIAHIQAVARAKPQPRAGEHHTDREGCDMTERACKRCGADMYGKGSDALFCSAKCRNTAYRKANAEKIAERQREWKKANPTRIAEHKRKWQKANAVKLAEYYRDYRKRIAEQRREYLQAEREQRQRRNDMADLQDKIAVLLWRTEATNAGAPDSIAAGRTLAAFAEQSPELRARWLKFADAIIAALPELL